MLELPIDSNDDELFSYAHDISFSLNIYVIVIKIKANVQFNVYFLVYCRYSFKINQLFNYLSNLHFLG